MSSYEKGGAPPSYGDPSPQAGYPNPNYNTQYGAPPPQPMYPSSGGGHYNQQGGTTVIVNQPMPGAPGAAPRMWSSGICAMCEDVGICLCGMFCGLCLACQVSTDMGESACVPCCVPAADIVLRTKWRTQENIHGSILDDCMTVWCCGPCAMCQLAREVKAKKNGMLNPRA